RGRARGARRRRATRRDAVALRPGRHHQCVAPRSPERDYRLVRPARWRDRAARARRRRGSPADPLRQRPHRDARAARGTRWQPARGSRPGTRRRAGRQRTGEKRSVTSAGGANAANGQRVRIALVDDQALVLRGLSALLAEFADLEIALESLDAQLLADALETRPVDVVVSDIRMPGLDGIGLIRMLRERGDATPVILLTTFDDSDLLLRAVEAGAQGFLLKDASPEDLHAAIRRVADGETLLQPVSLGAVRA